MNVNNSSQPYMRSVAQVAIGQRPQGLRVRIGKFPTGSAFWRPVGKALLVLLPLVLAFNLYVISSTAEINESIIAVDNRHHELMDKNIELRALRAHVKDPEQLQKLAAEKLSLFVHEKGQVGMYVHQRGYFTFL